MMILKSLLLCTSIVISLSHVMASEQDKKDDSGLVTKTTPQKVIIDDSKVSDFEQLRLEMQKMKEANSKMAEMLENVQRKLDTQAPKLSMQAPSDLPPVSPSYSTVTVVTTYEGPTKEDVTFAVEKLKKETERVSKQVEKEVDRNAKRFGKFLKKVGEQVKDSFESDKVVVEVKTQTFGSQDQIGSQLTHVNSYKIPLEERQKVMSPIIDWSTFGTRFPGLDTASIWQLDLEKFCKTQDGADMKPVQFSSDPAVIFILNRFGITSKHCMDARSLYINMFKSGVCLSKNQVRWLGYPFKGVGRN